MENLRDIVRMYFQKVSSHNILRGMLVYHKFSREDFDALALQELPHLSETESNEIYSFLEQKIGSGENENGLNVFCLLKETVSEYLMVRQNRPICRYEKLLSWRELTGSIGEDLPVCAFLAYRTEHRGYIWNDFEWSTVIGHDNMQLNRIMQKGISDNHFHLFGSAPSFQLIWIRLMNQPENGKYRTELQKIDLKKRQTRNKYSVRYEEDSLQTMCFQAALIRAVLFYYINLSKHGHWKEADEIILQQEKIQKILVNHLELECCYGRIQCFIDSLRMMKELAQNDVWEDYLNLGQWARGVNHEFEGERALLYQMLLKQVNGRPIPEVLLNWFYAYLVIQVKLREELVQVNNTIGFENFSQYSKRKSKFLYLSGDNRKIVQHAVYGSFENGNMRSLELRVTPDRTAEKNSLWLKRCDDYIRECLGEGCLNRIYYVLHFPKRKDDLLINQTGILEFCRHEKYRHSLMKTADELVRFRDEYPKEAARVLGIDACSQEIGCRPEVFAPVFRQLTNHVVYDSLFGNVRQWKITYHVGEDWLDAVDGLRAIDEAVLFLNMKNGDRLGHAMVLGLNIRKWYEKKRNGICIPLQDYLDNVVWLYHKLIEFDIPCCEALKGSLNSEYDRCFKKLYQKYMKEKVLHYDINTYYAAWKLRGDQPLLYKNGTYENTHHFFGPYWVNEEMESGWELRKEKSVALLMYYYHYSSEVRCVGSRVEDIKVPQIYVDGVEKVQKAMQQFIAQKGISVETNPSSNYVISTMDKYEEHPISELYNIGLTWDKDEVQHCAQIHVSINTDDKGVFHTSLENEYALMACAMEQMKDEHGKQKYQKQMVYQWLDHIRENGNQQSFLEQIYEGESGCSY